MFADFTQFLQVDTLNPLLQIMLGEWENSLSSSWSFNS